MKKMFFMALAVVAIAFASCGGGNTPSDAAKKYYGYAAAGDWEKFADGFKTKNSEQKEFIVTMLTEKGALEIKKKGGIKSYSVISETIDEENPDKAEVKMLIVYGNGTEEEEELDLIKSEGKWLMTMNK